MKQICHSPSLSRTFIIILSLLSILFTNVPAYTQSNSQSNSCEQVLKALNKAIDSKACNTVDIDNVCYGSKSLISKWRKKDIIFKNPGDNALTSDASLLETESPSGVAVIYASTDESPVKIVIFGNSQLIPESNQVYTLRKSDNGKLLCDKTPSGLMLQTSNDEKGQVTINGVTIRLGSTVFINFDAPVSRVAFSQVNQLAITELMTEYDAIWTEALRDNQSSRLSEVLDGSLLDNDTKMFNENGSNGCYWVNTVVTPAELVAIERTGPSTAKVYVNKNWDLDYFCSGVKRGDDDGAFVGIYTVEFRHEQWRIVEREIHNVSETDKPSPSTSGGVELMTITNIEGNVDVLALGESRSLEPGQKTQVTISDNTPVDISEVSENPEIALSPVIPWLATAPEALPAVNRTINPQSSPTPLPPTNTQFILTGYYDIETRRGGPDFSPIVVCDQLVVTSGDPNLINELLDSVKQGNTINGQNGLGQLRLTLELQSLSPAEQSLIRSTTIDSPVTLTVSKRGLIPPNGISDPCESSVDILDVTRATVSLPLPVTQYSLTGYYTQTAQAEYGGSDKTRVCDRLVVTDGDSILINEFLDLVKQGNSVNAQNELGQLILNIDLQNLSSDQQSLIQSATNDSAVTLTVSRHESLGGDANACYSFVDVIGVSRATAILPDPLYYVDETTQQIFRMERDGITVSQITFESKGSVLSTGLDAPPVTGFDISPIDGSIVYVNKNDLIQTDSKGRNRIVKVVGGSIGSMRVISDLSDPLFSPDGKTIAFVFTGIALISTESGSQFEVILPHELLLSSGADDPRAWLFHAPVSWSPDSKRLLINSFQFQAPTVSSGNILDVNTHSIISILNEDRPNGEHPTNDSVVWTKNGQSIYNGSKTLNISAIGNQLIPGLFIIDSSSGRQSDMLAAPNDNQQHTVPFVQAPMIVEDGNQLFFFANLGTVGNLQDLMFAPIYPDDYALYQSDLNGNDLKQVGVASFGNLDQIRWEQSGKGAIGVVDGQIIWISQEGQSIPLGVRGSSPKWGIN